MTLLACPIFVHDIGALSGALDQAQAAVTAGAQVVEWRVDALAGDDAAGAAVGQLLAGTGVPCIVTCRAAWEGGLAPGDDLARLELLTLGVRSNPPPKYIDLELETLRREPGATKSLIEAVEEVNGRAGVEIGIIFSSHDFRGRPSDLIQRIEAMTEEPAGRVLKVAWFARSLRDNVEAFSLLRERTKPTIALCMGAFGLMSRVLAPKFGGFMTFASAGAGDETAPGQPTIDHLRTMYRFDSIGRDTKVYGVIGWPVGHSLGPKLHNAGFKTVGHDGVYLPLPVPSEYEHFKATVGALIDFEPLDFRGASVTLPHKEHLVRFVEERGGVVEPVAKVLGVANTLMVRDDGTIECDNTDGPAALDALCAAMKVDRDGLAEKTVAVLGAGGAARAVAGSLALLGSHVTIFNRTPGSAESLAMVFQGRMAETGEPIEMGVAERAQLSQDRFDIYVNCTSVGMTGGPAEGVSPLPLNAPLDDGVTVFDTVYNPERTPLIQQAEAAGARTVRGMDMFIRQAAMQFEMWTGKSLPVGAIDIASM